MDCPVDKEPMLAVEYDDIEIDYCPHCEGIWLDAGELELLFGDPAACRAFLSGGTERVPAAEKPRRCPICRAKMDKATTRGDAPVTYDHCPNGDGLWLDRGELPAILKYGASGGEGDQVADFLRAMFPGDTPTQHMRRES